LQREDLPGYGGIAMSEQTLRELHDQAIREGKLWSVKAGKIELVEPQGQDHPFNLDVERKLQKLGLRWIW
jgi:hypothetical protein